MLVYDSDLLNILCAQDILNVDNVDILDLQCILSVTSHTKGWLVTCNLDLTQF